MPRAQLTLPPEPASVGTARAMLRQALADWDLEGLEFAASQALTELATNAVIHARTEFVVSAIWEADTLRVCVEDQALKLPMQRSYGLDATTGRGLAMVELLCRSWGVERFDEGKRVWFELSPTDVAGDDTDVLALFGDFDDFDELGDLDDVTGHGVGKGGAVSDRACAA